MATTGQFLADEKLLYNLFVEHVKNEIHKMIKPEIDKIINEAVDQAAISLEGALHQYYDPSSFMRTVKVVVEKK